MREYDDSLLRHCSIALLTMLRWNSVHVSASRCRNSTTIHILEYTLMHHVQVVIIHNLGRTVGRPLVRIDELN